MESYSLDQLLTMDNVAVIRYQDRVTDRLYKLLMQPERRQAAQPMRGRIARLYAQCDLCQRRLWGDGRQV